MKPSDSSTPDPLDAPATKRDLVNFATKDDLLKFATKDDLLKLATKDELREVRDELRNELREVRDELRDEIRGQGVRIEVVISSIQALSESISGHTEHCANEHLAIEERLVARIKPIEQVVRTLSRDVAVLQKKHAPRARAASKRRG